MQVEMAEYSLTSKYSESQEYFQHRRNLDLSPYPYGEWKIHISGYIIVTNKICVPLNGGTSNRLKDFEV